MPGFTTHYLFGVKAYNDLPNNYLKHVISKYRWLYQIGLQGPDIFFYNIPILRHRDYRNVGSHMHEYHVNRFFRNCLNEIAAISSKQQREQAISYMAGFLCHYAADSICHPYVYGRIQYVEDHGVQTRMLFAGNLTKHPCFDEMRAEKKGYRIVGELKNTDRIMTDTFWVGVYPGMTDEKIDYMAKVIKEGLEQ